MARPHAVPIKLSSRQQSILQQIARRTTNPYRLVLRAQLVLLAAQGVDNTEIGRRLQLSRAQLRLWRQRWHGVDELLTTAQAEGISDEGLTRRTMEVFSNELRLGTPAKFSLEEMVQIVAVACEQPHNSERPVSQWTPRELTSEAVKRSIVQQISPRSVGRFLKRGQSATPPQSLLAQY